MNEFPCHGLPLCIPVALISLLLLVVVTVMCATVGDWEDGQPPTTQLQLKSVLSDFYSVTATSDQVSNLESTYNTSLLHCHHDINNPLCRGKPVDMHALACIYNVTFQLVHPQYVCFLPQIQSTHIHHTHCAIHIHAIPYCTKEINSMHRHYRPLHYIHTSNKIDNIFSLLYFILILLSYTRI